MVFLKRSAPEWESFRTAARDFLIEWEIDPHEVAEHGFDRHGYRQFARDGDGNRFRFDSRPGYRPPSAEFIGDTAWIKVPWTDEQLRDLIDSPVWKYL